jgi:NAD(P)-dependent dehydrogenase (short-subunit alcohol dehydrogenase family)
MHQPDLFDLSGRVALVTGASRGIGAAVARLLAARGAQVVVSSRKLDACETVAASIRAAGGKAEAFACHIGDMAQIDAVYQHLEARYGRLDILVNNAATNPYFGPIADTDEAAFQKTVDVNIRGYFFMSSRGIKLMARHGKGSIVNVASVNGVTPGDMQGIYSITKAAVISMTRAFARECAPLGVRVNALLPGATDTKFASALFDDPVVMQRVMNRVPMQRLAQPEEMAGTVLYLASDAASYTTGACINVDGGYLSS